jgi:hypothetical protein
MRPDHFSYTYIAEHPCRRCAKPIAENEPALRAQNGFESLRAVCVLRDRSDDPRAQSMVYHLRCAVDVHHVAASHALSRCPATMQGRDAMLALANARIAAKLRTTKKTQRPALEPATDPSGRPRVRVIFVASSNDVLPTEPQALRRASLLDLDTTVVDTTIRSPLREYALHRHEAAQDLEPEPSQPTVAGLFWQKTTAGVVAVFAKRLAEWRSLGLASPVLVVVGPGASDSDVLDPLVLKLRSLVERAGFDPDDAPVVSGESVDAALLEALALALDERCGVGAGPSTTSARSEGAIANLERVVAEGRDEALIATAGAALKVYATASRGDRRRILHAIFQGARTPELASKTVVLLRPITVGLPRGGLTELARSMLRTRSKLASTFEQLVDYWRVGTGEREAMLQLLLDTVCAAPLTDRAKRCVALLEREGDATMLPRLREIIDNELAARPAERAVFEGLLRAIEAKR